MTLQIPSDILERIHANGQAAYPEEGAGLMLGTVQAGAKRILEIVPMENAREDAARRNRYLLTPQAYLRAEKEADRLGLEVLGVFHSHPDHPNRPSEFDLEWAMPWFSYLITSVNAGIPAGSRAWLLTDDRTQFAEEPLKVIPERTAVSK
jgi:proteasome lid subunit RPN8/RPN11